MIPARRLAAAAWLAIPGLLLVYVAFRGGGYFAGTQGVLAAAIAIVLILRTTLAADPFGGASRALALAAGALALLAAWMLASSAWSHAPARSLLEFDLALLYLLMLMLFGTAPLTVEGLRWMVRGVAVGAAAVCTVALITRTLPDVWHVAPNIANSRLSYPITYWNALGLVGVLGAILSLHMTCSEREPRVIRVLAAALLPVLATTVYLTFSRGAIAVGVVGLVTYIALGRPRLLIAGVLAGAGSASVAVVVAYSADRLASNAPTQPAAVAQGHDVALAVALCAVAAGGLRVGLLALDSVIVRREPRRRIGRLALAAIVVVAVVAGSGVAAAAGLPQQLRHQYNVFVKRKKPRNTGDLRDRLVDPSNHSRLDAWRVALKSYRAHPLRGQGAGSYEAEWIRRRPEPYQIVNAHSLYLETLSELGLVGLGLLAVVLLTLLVGAARRIRGPDRALYAAIFAVTTTWLLHAGVDWDWQMPVVTLWLFAVGGAVLATPVPARARAAAAPIAPPRVLRVGVGLGLLVLAILPVQMALSQSRLNAGVVAFRRGDCRGAIDHSLGAIEAVAARPQPRAVIAFCDARLGMPGLGAAVMADAVARDPHDWEYRYGLALLRAQAGLDPRPAAREALRLNPREPLAQLAVRSFATRDRNRWRQRALHAGLPPV